MSSPEVEKFEITEEDLAYEFQRPKFYQSKGSAIYGIWNDSDEEEDARPGFGGGGRKKKDFTAPMNFVSGGIKIGDKVSKVKDETNITDSDDDEPAPQPSRKGRGGMGRGRGHGAAAAFFNKKSTDVGDWEKHTRGIGQKLLQKMGFESGKGLGKNLQGIQAPVEAFKRKGKAAVGFYGSERTKTSLKHFPKHDSEEEEDKDFQLQLQQWKKPVEGEKKKKPKYVYKTADQIIATGGKKSRRANVPDEMAKVKVIDMTGKEQRVLSGYHALSQRHDRPDSDSEEEIPHTKVQKTRSFDMPELLHNLDLLVSMAEEEIILNNKKLQYEGDMVVNLKHESEKLDATCEQEEKHLNKLAEILTIVEKCEERMVHGCENPLTLEQCAKLFQRLQDEFYEEYKIYELAALAVALVFPLMKREFEGWTPLTDQHHGFETMKTWRRILEDPNQQFNQGQGFMEPYERIIWEAWVPHIRNTINCGWSVRSCDSLIELVEIWLPLLPNWILTNIMEQLVLPRLQKEVEEWNPLTDTMPIHAWLHPWLPLMGKRLEPLYAPIRHKLSNALTSWHPSDPSAKMILQPWQAVWERGHLDAFLVKNILPKLELCLQEFIINPHQQHLDPWNWVLSWLDMLPLVSLVGLLDQTFFPKWHQVLCTWLNSNPNYEEVSKWYVGWKNMFPERLITHPTIKEHFGRALDLMNRAVSGNYQPGARENIAYLTSTERRREYETKMAQDKEYEALKSTTAINSIPSSFKELIERKAEEHGIIFVPIPNKTREAKQVYRFGRAQIYIDRGVVFVMNDNGQWIPVSLNNLVDRAR